MPGVLIAGVELSGLGCRCRPSLAWLVWGVEMARQSIEPLLWLLFSAGGVLAALLAADSAVAVRRRLPLGWLDAARPRRTSLALLRQPVDARRALRSVPCRSFHGAHRFRYTLYDGLQIKHLNELIAVLCYGGAIVGSVRRAT